MNVYFIGVGGTGIGPLALIAHQAGFTVSGSDKQDSEYLHYLKKQGLSQIEVGDGLEQITFLHKQSPIDWIVYSSAVPKENPNHPIIKWAEANGVKTTKRDEFLSHLLLEKNLKLIAIAGTHGKTTTTAMVVWLFKQLGLPISYSVGAKLSFGQMGEFATESQYFVYECDEYDRNFLSFSPFMSLISGIDYDHPDIYPTRQEYYQAFCDFIAKSKQTIIWQTDADKLKLDSKQSGIICMSETALGLASLKLLGEVNRRNARLAIQAVAELNPDIELEQLDEIMNNFPGISRRFEQILHGVYSDYAHTPDKIRGALQLAQEVADDNVVVVYEGLHNTRQHFIKEDLKHLFDNVKKLYIVPSYRAREDESLEDLTPVKLISLTSQPRKAEPAELNETLKDKILEHVRNGDLVLCLTAGGGGSLDEWLRAEFRK